MMSPQSWMRAAATLRPRNTDLSHFLRAGGCRGQSITGQVLISMIFFVGFLQS